ncbi:PAS domain S-box protein [Thalassoroseus pseudoceratinae]|uniref:PAS domain S-box protein n=1 Tax=Thalassoroseus pseudoceratinae TaxID=2713176 RepID=UPI00141E37AC|nr:PAS domain S-box protein [Thalassoroseus pseudoceratinae]
MGSTDGDRVFDEADSLGRKNYLQSSELLETVLAAFRAVAWEWDLSEDQIVFTENAAKALRLAIVAESLPSSRWFDLIHPDDQKRHRDVMTDVISQGGEYKSEYRVIRPDDGTILWLMEQGRAFPGHSGKTVSLSGVVRDISEQKQVEQRHRQFVLLAENSDEFIGMCDEQLRPFFINPAGVRLVGLDSREKALQTPVRDFFFPDDQPKMLNEFFPRVLREGRGEVEIRFRHFKTGQPLWVIFGLFALVDEHGGPMGFATITRDITERKQTETTLRNSAERYHTLFESIDEGFCIIEMIFDDNDEPYDYRFLEVNQAFEKYTGLRNAVGKRMREFAPNHETHWYEIYGRVAMTGESVRCINEAKALGRWYEVAASRIGSPEDRHVAVLFNDITDRKQAESERERLHREVETERERLIDVFQRAPSFMAVVNGPDHVFERVNDRYYQLVGHRELIGIPVRKALPEIAGQGLFEALDKVYETGEPFVATGMPVLLQRQPNDPPEERFLDFVYQALYGPDGEITGILAQGIDLTERKHAEAALRENEQRFRTLVEQVQDYAIFMTDSEGRATSWNEGVRQVLGFSESEFLGQDIGPIIFTREDIVNGAPQIELDTAAANGRARSDRWMQRKDGTQFFATGITAALHDEVGKLVGFMKVMRDETNQRHLEENLRRVAADLSEANRRKSEFLATLGHELRNPLAPIRTGLEIMKLAADDPVIMEDTRSMMERQTQQMVRLIDDLLDVSRISRGKMTLKTCDVVLADVLQSAVESTRPLIDEAGQELSISMPTEATPLHADPNRLAQVFSNLLHNATKYTPEGGHIELSVELQKDDVLVSVKDNGIGIPIELQAGIFELFSQIDQSIGKSYEGLGIGLTLVKQLVEMHGGDITVQSAGADQGSEFTVRLPVCVEIPPDPSPPSSSQPADKVMQLRILVVDDNHAAADMLAMVVSMIGNDVRTAYDGSQGVQVAESFRPDVVLMDLGMPVMTGYEAARHIREQDWGRDMILVALTGWGQEEDRQRTKEAGFDHHLVKPAEPATLQQLLIELASQSD